MLGCSPFQVTDETKAMVVDNICFLLNSFIHCSAYENVIFCWVMHKQSIIDGIINELDTENCVVKKISLTVDEMNLQSRLMADVTREIRNRDVIDRSAARISMYQALDTIKIDTSNKTVREIVDDMSQIIWHGVHANAVRTAFDRLTSDEKEYLQRRNALCMKCGCARNIKYGESFDDLGAHFELTTANGAEKAYRKAVDHLTRLLVEDNVIGAVIIKRQKVIRRKKKIAAAIYEYQADYDGDWGEIEIDFANGTGKISYIAELDTTRSHRYANRAIEEILSSDLNDLPKQKTIAFPK